MNSWRASIYIASAWVSALIIMSYACRLAEHIHSCNFRHSQHLACQEDNAKFWHLYGQRFKRLVLLEFRVIYFDVHHSWSWWKRGSSHTFRQMCIGHVRDMWDVDGVPDDGCAGKSDEAHCKRDQSTWTTALIKREQSRRLYIIAAVNTISLWWRKMRKQSMITRKQHQMGLYGYRREFVAAQRVLKVEIEECASTGAKIEQVVQRTKLIHQAVDEVGIHILMHLNPCPTHHSATSQPS